jgi:hypothetical protein
MVDFLKDSKIIETNPLPDVVVAGAEGGIISVVETVDQRQGAGRWRVPVDVIDEKGGGRGVIRYGAGTMVSAEVAVILGATKGIICLDESGNVASWQNLWPVERARLRELAGNGKLPTELAASILRRLD